MNLEPEPFDPDSYPRNTDVSPWVQTIPLGALFPGEPANRELWIQGLRKAIAWRKQHRRVTLRGEFNYEYKGTQYVTEFEGFLNFHLPVMPMVDWKHTDAR